MKKVFFVFVAFILVAFTVNKLYRDGQYFGTSRAIYTNEPFYGHTKIVIEKGKIIKVDFFVRDSSRHEFFDGKYEKYYAGNDKYIMQCRNDWKGVQSYPDSLLKHQDLDKIDAISGATWSYNLFKASVKKALLDAEKTK